ncbi:MAG: GntR family transcriptional regulator [Rhodoglobus sp.]
MDISVDHKAAATLYEQLHTQLLERIADGTLIAGTKLPTVRQFATDLGVATYTVARVYKALEADGFIETLGRNGTLVSARTDTSQSLLQRAASDYAARSRELGLGADEALAYVRAALAQ